MDSYSLGYANIALVKYWGKKSKDPVLPYNPNISLRLDNLLSKTKIEKNDSNVDEFYINDEKQVITQYLLPLDFLQVLAVLWR